MRRAVLAAAVLAAALFAVPAQARAGTAPTLAVVKQSNTARELTFSAWFPAGTSAVGVVVGNREATRVPVSPDSSGTIAVSAHIDAETAVAKTYDAAGTLAGVSPALALGTGGRKPSWSAADIKGDQVCGPKWVITGRVDPRTTSIAVTDQNRKVLWRGSVKPTGSKHTFKLPAIALARGRTTVYLTASNAWGGKKGAGVRVHNLGSDVPKSDDFLMVDRDVCDMYYVRGRVLRRTYPVAVGMPGTPTPRGTFYLGRPVGVPNSAWGPLRMPLRRKTKSGYSASSYYIHGTDTPSSIGTWASHGCVRMYNTDVRGLSKLLYANFPVCIRH